jgi:D-psicose/D-tagatose/L-ribulose 3-epimerase
MRFGIISLVWGSELGPEDLDCVAEAAAFGYDVFEFTLDRPGRMDPGRLAEALDRAGMECIVTALFRNHDAAGRDAEARREAIDYITDCVSFCARIGSPVLAGPMASVTGRCELLTPNERCAELRRSAESLREAAQFAGEHGVRLAIEPLNRFQTHLLTCVEDGRELCNLVGENAGLLLDTFHMNIEELSLGDAIRAAGDLIVHFHASENDRGVPGRGHVPWVEVASALRDIEYSGIVSIEAFTTASPALAEALRQWRSAFESPAEIGEEGLAFLRGTFAAA